MAFTTSFDYPLYDLRPEAEVWYNLSWIEIQDTLFNSSTNLTETTLTTKTTTTTTTEFFNYDRWLYLGDFHDNYPELFWTWKGQEFSRYRFY